LRIGLLPAGSDPFLLAYWLRHYRTWADEIGGGKARLAKKLLWDAGWECLADEYQTLWSKPYVAEAAA